MGVSPDGRSDSFTAVFGDVTRGVAIALYLANVNDVAVSRYQKPVLAYEVVGQIFTREENVKVRVPLLSFR